VQPKDRPPEWINMSEIMKQRQRRQLQRVQSTIQKIQQWQQTKQFLLCLSIASSYLHFQNEIRIFHHCCYSHQLECCSIFLPRLCEQCTTKAAFQAFTFPSRETSDTIPVFANFIICIGSYLSQFFFIKTGIQLSHGSFQNRRWRNYQSLQGS